MTAGQPTTNGVGAAKLDLFPTIRGDLERVERDLRKVVHSRVPVVPEVYLHTVHAGGKRIRPALALLAGRAAGQLCEATFDVAVAVELLHIASLIHDDVIDDGERRRARLTANRVWGNKTAVLVADYTHSIAYRQVIPRCGAACVERLSATVVRMVEGELNQMYHEGSLVADEPLYYSMIEDKTASLMALAGELGAKVSGGSDAQVEQCRRYGLRVGTAFQIVDDLLDLFGDEARIGKPVGNDLRCGRVTLPLIYTLNQAEPAYGQDLLDLLRRDEIDQATLLAIRELTDLAGGREYAWQQARRLVGEARAALTDLPRGEARSAMEALADYVVERRL